MQNSILKFISRSFSTTRMSGKFFVCGNWKLNGTKKIADEILGNLAKAPLDPNAEVLIGVPSVYLDYVKKKAPSNINVAAQNCYKAENAPFTGEIGASMLKDIGIDWVILGNIERRVYFHETNTFISDKASFALDAGLSVIVCIGDDLEAREDGLTKAVVTKQIKAIGDKICNWENVVVAYEPYWALSKVVRPQQAQEVHQILRKWLADEVNETISKNTRIIYGGPISAANCKEFAKENDIDGFLVGDASLKPEFVDIVNAQK